MSELEREIRSILAQYARLDVDATDESALPEDTDLYAAGMTSHASVTVMLGCEDTFDVEFPAALLTKSTFGSVAALRSALEGLDATGAA